MDKINIIGLYPENNVRESEKKFDIIIACLNLTLVKIKTYDILLH
jgi:hypothetical protein